MKGIWAHHTYNLLFWEKRNKKIVKIPNLMVPTWNIDFRHKYEIFWNKRSEKLKNYYDIIKVPDQSKHQKSAKYYTFNKGFEEKLGNMENFERKWYESGYIKIIENPVSSLLSLWIVILTVIVIFLWIKLNISESYIIKAAFK